MKPENLNPLTKAEAFKLIFVSIGFITAISAVVTVFAIFLEWDDISKRRYINPITELRAWAGVAIVVFLYLVLLISSVVVLIHAIRRKRTRLVAWFLEHLNKKIDVKKELDNWQK